MRGLFDSYVDLSGVACLSYVSVITEETFLKSYGVLDAWWYLHRHMLFNQPLHSLL